MPPSPLWRIAFAAIALAALSLHKLPAQETNIALGRPVSASAATWSGQVPENLTDGNTGNQSHPLAGSGTLGFFYEIDLETTRNLGSIVLHNRTACCPERLSNYNVTVYADANGAPGAPNWSADIRTDGTNSGNAGTDTITPDLDPAGTLAGRFIRVTNLSNAAYNPQIAELEAFEAPLPTISFTVDHGNITQTGNPDLPGSATLSWAVAGATSVSIAPTLGSVPDTGSRSVSPAATTTYTLSASNGIGTATDTVTVGVDAPTLPPVLTEFMASNGGSHTDDSGSSPDWIELFNPNPFNLSLDGYYLTDDPDIPTKWRLPAVSVPAESHLVIFASGDDRTDPLAELHTNFQLSASGEYLALVSPDGTTVRGQFPADHPTTLTFPPQRENRSYGIAADGTAGYFFPATPGAPNGTSFAGFVQDTSFSTDRGFYTDPVTVEITTLTVGATIRYTTDGSEPTPTHGTPYTTPLTISETTTLRALAHQDGLAPTNVDTHTYVFATDVISQRNMDRAITQNATYGPQLPAALTDLPAMSVVTGGTINGTSEIATSLEMIFPDGTPGFQENCGIKNYGGAFTNFAKKNFRFYFRSSYGAAKLNFPVFSGLARGNGFEPASKFDQIVLRAGSHDMVQRGFYMSNRFTDDTMLDMGQINPHGRFVHLYINGTYWGLYHLRERWNAANQASYLGGSKDDYESINGNWNVGGWSLAGPADAYDGDGSAWERIKTLTGDYDGIRPYLDVPHYVDYMLMFMFGNAEDEYRCVGPAGVGSGFKWFLNDADGYLRTSAGNNTAFGSGNPPRSRGAGPWGIFAGLFREGHPDYLTLLADRIHKHYFNDGALTPARNGARLRERTDRIARAFIAESARWGYRTPASWERERDIILNSWFRSRTNAVLNDFRRARFYPSLAAPVFSQHGGQVPAGFVLDITAPSTVHYTADGSDPRLPGGAVSPSALTYTSTGNTTTATLVPTGASWRFLDDGSDQQTAWRATAFDDASWKTGDAELGYGQTVPQTDVDWGTDPTDRHITTYFRHTFTVDDPTAIVAASIQIKRDDGAVVYLNGTEVDRTSMPDGEITAATLAAAATDDGRDFHPLTVPPGLFQQGTNTLAVEVHQQAANSSDLSFDLSLEIETSDAPDDPLRITKNTWIRSRTKSGNSWSALNGAFFQSANAAPVAPADLVISELNYNPDGNGEFVELLNIADHAINLRGSRFTNGIQYDFPTIDDTVLAPGGRLLLVSSLYAFQQTYGIDLPVAGIFRGSLDNAGEQITLTAPDLVTALVDLTYSDESPWPTTPDGDGKSLVLADPQNPTNPASYRPSLTPGGTPLSTDTVPYSPGTDLLAYALASPLTASLDPDSHLLLTYSRPIAHDDATTTIESSPDLATFTPTAGTFTLHNRQENPDNTETLTFRSTSPIAPSSTHFYHLSITTK